MEEKLAFRIDKILKDELKKIARDNGMNMSTYVKRLITIDVIEKGGRL